MRATKAGASLLHLQLLFLILKTRQRGRQSGPANDQKVIKALSTQGVPISRSAIASYHGDRGEIGRSHIPPGPETSEHVPIRDAQ